MYFMISQDGTDTRVSVMGKEEVEAILNEKGGPRVLTAEEYENLGNVGNNPAYWPANSCLIVKGEIAEVTIGKLNID